MCLALSKLPKESNSVSSQAKMMLSLHVCIKNVEFYKYKIVFFRNLINFHVCSLTTVFQGDYSVSTQDKEILSLHVFIERV